MMICTMMPFRVATTAISVMASGDRPVVRARYEYADVSSPGLGDRLDKFLEQLPRDV